MIVTVFENASANGYGAIQSIDGAPASFRRSIFFEGDLTAAGEFRLWIRASGMGWARVPISDKADPFDPITNNDMVVNNEGIATAFRNIDLSGSQVVGHLTGIAGAADFTVKIALS